MSDAIPLIKTTTVRQGRFTLAQKKAMTALWPRYAWSVGALPRSTVLEIGCGRGDHLVAAAQRHPDWQFIGVDLYRPGLGVLLQQLERHQLDNVRVYADDVRGLLAQLPSQSLQGLQIFFPDPWRKNRHHKRRLIQVSLVTQIATVLMPGGFLHMVTDWCDYAGHIDAVMGHASMLYHGSSPCDLPVQRYVTSAFERKAHLGKRPIAERVFIRRG